MLNALSAPSHAILITTVGSSCVFISTGFHFYRRIVSFYAKRRSYKYIFSRGSPGSSDGKESACPMGDPGRIPGLGRSPGEGIGNPLQYSCLENSMDRGVWWATIHGVAKSQIQLKD